MKTQFTIGIFGMIFDEQGRILLCHRKDYDLWNLPGGALESGEAPWDGVKREVKEETGLDVQVSKLHGVYSKPDKNDIVFSFVCHVVAGEITLNDEADRIEYFEIDKLPPNTVPPRGYSRSGISSLRSCRGSSPSSFGRTISVRSSQCIKYG